MTIIPMIGLAVCDVQVIGSDERSQQHNGLGLRPAGSPISRLVRSCIRFAQATNQMSKNCRKMKELGDLFHLNCLRLS